MHEDNRVSVDRKMVDYVDIWQFFNLSVKYRSNFLVNSSGLIHDTELQMDIQEQGCSHLSFKYVFCNSGDRSQSIIIKKGIEITFWGKILYKGWVQKKLTK